MTNKTATLIVSSDDTNLSIDDKHRSKVALDYSTILSSNQSMDYLFNSIPDNIESLPILIAREWYRDSKGIDSHQNSYSIGMILEKRIAIMTSNLIKFYFGFSNLANKYDSIEVPANYPKYLYDIIEHFKKKIVFIEKQKYSSDVELLFTEKGIVTKVKVSKYSWFFRMIQKPFMRFLTNKTLVFPDWTYSKYKHSNYIYQNKVNFFKSFYYKNTCKPLDFIRPEVNTEKINSILSKYDIQTKDQKSLCKIINNMIGDEINNSLAYINQQYSVMLELINYYKPKKVIIPCDGEHTWYNMLFQILNKLNIDSTTVLDGYLTYLEKEQIRVTEDGKTPLVNNYATMGSINHKMVGNIYPKFNRILIKSPILSHMPNRTSSKEKYDALVMMPIPNPKNPNSRWDMRNKYVIELVILLKELRFKKIAIKVKPGANLNDTNFLINYFKKNNIEDIDFLRGYAYDAISISKIVIGQLGTTTFESLVMNTPYYIYEPIYCGLSDENVSNSFTSTRHISRNINTLSKNITNSDTIDLPIDQLIDGQEMPLRII